MSQKHGQFAVTLECVEEQEPDQWAELLANGLTFDVSGLASGRACRFPAEANRFYGFAEEFDPAGCEGIVLSPGPHLVSGGPMVPVLRCLAWLTAELSELPHLSAIVWQAAGSVNEPGHFRESITRWLGGGAFPGLGLTSLAAQADGTMKSQGLSLFTGQELVLDASLSQDKAQGAKMALRLLHWMVENGKIEETLPITGPAGDNLTLEPSAEKGIVTVWRGSR